ncbi:MAG: DNA translocase FtsK, partial [Tannerellaceae bacterium]|nr:DNA translocase FtsK [Tannerellaceae bacterium]
IKRRLNPEKGHKFMPYIVVIIDEFGDLIMTAGKEIELPIARIAQKARAVGIHMVIATQRPSTNIITGTIKANFPARMAFRVSSMIDSRTILDSPGANQLIGRGDLLFSQGNDMIRVQCAFVDTPEVEQVASFIGTQQGYPTAFLLPEYVGENDADKMPGAVDLSDRDALFDEAARLLVIQQQGSTSLIQRKFAIGYNRAGRLMDQLEAAGIVGPFEGSKARQVLIQDEYNLERLLNSLK